MTDTVIVVYVDVRRGDDYQGQTYWEARCEITRELFYPDQPWYTAWCKSRRKRDAVAFALAALVECLHRDPPER